MSDKSITVGFIIIILGGAGYLYFLTDTFLSPSEKFLKELEYYENLRLDITDYSIDTYFWKMEDIWSFSRDNFELIEVSKQELRNYIETGDYFGASSDIKYYTELDFIPPDMSYDPTRLELWVIGMDSVIYYWSPR